MPTSRQITEVRGLPPGRDYLVSIFKFTNKTSPNSAKWMVDEIFAGQGYYAPVIDPAGMDDGNLELNWGSERTDLMPNICRYTGNVPGEMSPFAFYSARSSWAGSSADIGSAGDGSYVWEFNEDGSYINCEEQGGVWELALQNASMISDGVVLQEIEIRFYPKLAVEIDQLIVIEAEENANNPEA